MTTHILHRARIGPVNKEKDCRHFEEIRPLNHSETMIVQDSRTKNFMKALEVYEETGNFVKAIEIVQGHDRLNWFYELFHKVQRRLFFKE